MKKLHTDQTFRDRATQSLHKKVRGNTDTTRTYKGTPRIKGVRHDITGKLIDLFAFYEEKDHLDKVNNRKLHGKKIPMTENMHNERIAA